MEKKEFLDINREYFKSIGFQTLKKSKFYYDSDKLTLRVKLFHSNYGEYYCVEYDFRLKILHSEIGSEFNDNIWDTVTGRLVYSRDKGFPIEYQSWDKEDYIHTLKPLAQKQLFPIMQYDIKYIKKLAKNCESVNAYILFKKDDRKRILSL